MTMKKQLNMVLEWHKAFGIPYSDNPVREQDWDLANLRENIMKDEVQEWAQDAKRTLHHEETIMKRAKELGDILFTVFGTIVTEGLQDHMERVFEEVYKSNMSKLDANGKPVMRHDGKVMKGPNYKYPDLNFLTSLTSSYEQNDRCPSGTLND